MLISGSFKSVVVLLEAINILEVSLGFSHLKYWPKETAISFFLFGKQIN